VTPAVATSEYELEDVVAPLDGNDEEEADLEIGMLLWNM